jgi:repressor LexA
MPTYTVRQQQVLEFVRATLEERGIAPTLEEIATDLGGISRVSVLDHLRALERKGAIRRRQREARAIEILDPQYVPSRGVPLVGTIAAGTPILEASVREDVDLEEFLGVDNGSFLLRVRGNSMIEDHICDGDLVLVESRTTARDGETVVAVVNEEVTLKRLQHDRDRVRLEPANGSLQPMVFPAGEVQIRGVVRGVIRRT